GRSPCSRTYPHTQRDTSGFLSTTNGVPSTYLSSLKPRLGNTSGAYSRSSGVDLNSRPNSCPAPTTPLMCRVRLSAWWSSRLRTSARDEQALQLALRRRKLPCELFEVEHALCPELIHNVPRTAWQSLCVQRNQLMQRLWVTAESGEGASVDGLGKNL